MSGLRGSRADHPIYRFIFYAAASYNIAFGLWAGLFPNAFFNLFRLPPPLYPSVWACLGMVVGLYGVMYAYAARHLDRARPLIAIGLAGKVLGPIGWLMPNELPARTFALIVFDDLIWWIPFAMFLLEGTSITKWLKRTAPYLCAAAHIVAGAGTLLLLRGGSEAVGDVGQRIAYLSQHSERWRVGWILWMVAALSLAGFYAWWGGRVAPRIAVIAFAIASFGLACDFAGESIFIGWLPNPGTALHRVASLLTGGAGNGLYTIAGIILTIATPSLPFRWLAWLTWASGIAMSVFTVMGNDAGFVASSALLMVFFIPWVIIMGVKLQ